MWDGNGRRTNKCCASCRRGTPAFGEMTCGKPECGCHEGQVTPEQLIVELNGGSK